MRRLVIKEMPVYTYRIMKGGNLRNQSPPLPRASFPCVRHTDESVLVQRFMGPIEIESKQELTQNVAM